MNKIDDTTIRCQEPFHDWDVRRHDDTDQDDPCHDLDPFADDQDEEPHHQFVPPRLAELEVKRRQEEDESVRDFVSDEHEHRPRQDVHEVDNNGRLEERERDEEERRDPEPARYDAEDGDRRAEP